MYVGISTQTFDLQGSLLFKADIPNTELESMTRRVTRTATLDGGVSITDSGYSEGDRTLNIVATLTEAQVDRLKYIFKNYSEVIMAIPEGIFLVNINSFNNIYGEVTLKVFVSEKLAPIAIPAYYCSRDDTFRNLNWWYITKLDSTETATVSLKGITDWECTIDLPDTTNTQLTMLYQYLIPAGDFEITLDLSDYTPDNDTDGFVILLRLRSSSGVYYSEIAMRSVAADSYRTTRTHKDGGVTTTDIDTLAYNTETFKFTRVGNEISTTFFADSWQADFTRDFTSHSNDIDVIEVIAYDTSTRGGSADIDNLLFVQGCPDIYPKAWTTTCSSSSSSTSSTASTTSSSSTFSSTTSTTSSSSSTSSTASTTSTSTSTSSTVSTTLSSTSTSFTTTSTTNSSSTTSTTLTSTSSTASTTSSSTTSTSTSSTASTVSTTSSTSSTGSTLSTTSSSSSTASTGSTLSTTSTSSSTSSSTTTVLTTTSSSTSSTASTMSTLSTTSTTYSSTSTSTTTTSSSSTSSTASTISSTSTTASTTSTLSTTSSTYSSTSSTTTSTSTSSTSSTVSTLSTISSTVSTTSSSTTTSSSSSTSSTASSSSSTTTTTYWCEYNEVFNDLDLWDFTKKHGGETATIVLGKMRLDLPNAQDTQISGEYQYLISAGDFDVRINMSNYNPDDGDEGFYIDFRIMDNTVPAVDWCRVRFQQEDEGNPFEIRGRSWINSAAQTETTVNIAGAPTGFRVTRVGSIITTYYETAGSWVEIRNDDFSGREGNLINIWLLAYDDTHYGGSVDFDNLIFADGCPVGYPKAWTTTSTTTTTCTTTSTPPP